MATCALLQANDRQSALPIVVLDICGPKLMMLLEWGIERFWRRACPSLSL
jgi:hypothetical protein